MTEKSTFKPILYWVQIQRGIAFFLDYVIAFLPLGSMLNFINFEYETETYFSQVLLILANLIYITIYFVYFEYKWGQTIGKRILGIKVYMENGSSVTLKAAIIRRLITYAFPVWWFDMALMYLTEKKQRLGDLMAHTVVVRTY